MSEHRRVNWDELRKNFLIALLIAVAFGAISGVAGLGIWGAAAGAITALVIGQAISRCRLH